MCPKCGVPAERIDITLKELEEELEKAEEGLREQIIQFEKLKAVAEQGLSEVLIRGELISKLEAELAKAKNLTRPAVISNICPICNKEADGAMLILNAVMYHADCIVERLNQLIDPDWEIGKEPRKIIGWLRSLTLPEKKKDNT